MLRNYLKVALRNILKHKAFSFVNVFGLALAMSVCMVIILMFAEQKSYDQFHVKKERIYRILSDRDNSKLPSATSPFSLADVLKVEYPVVEEATRLTRGVGGDIGFDGQVVEVRGYFADPAFFNVFSFELNQGNPGRALAAPYSIVITHALAQKLFGQEDAIGKTISFSDRGLFNLGDQPGRPAVTWGELTITGVLADMGYKSHLKFDALVSSSTITSLINEGKMEDLSNQWGNNQSYTYVLLQPGKAHSDLTNSLADLVRRRNDELKDIKGFALIAQKLVDITPGILVSNEPSQRLPLSIYYFLSFLASVIMVSACMNYTNLTTARALTRVKEIGVRKVTGAHRKDLVYQFLGESIITALLALGVATLLLILLKAAIVQLWVNQYLHFELRENLQIYLVFIGFAFFVGIVAGAYPAVYLSRHGPVKVLKDTGFGAGKLRTRKVLAVSQFVVSLLFITTSILIYDQFRHFLRFEYGFNPENIVNVPLKGNDFQKLKHAFATVPGVTTISACNYVPSTGTNNGISLKLAGQDVPYRNFVILIAGENFAENLQLHLLAGRHLDATDSANKFIVVNEAAVKALGFTHPDAIVGQALDPEFGREPLQVIGVVNDFFVKMPMGEDKVSPMVMRNAPAEFRYANIKIASADMASTISKLEKKWKEVDPLHVFEYEFYDDQLASMHRGLFDIISVLGFVAFVAVTIACLGMLGMATYTCERRKKEMGIRKVLGAGDMGIALLLSRDFLKVLAVSVSIGAPASFILNDLWLRHFPNRVEFGSGTVLLAAGILLSLGLITIGSQAIAASKRNPVEPLRSE